MLTSIHELEQWHKGLCHRLEYIRALVAVINGGQTTPDEIPPI